MESYRTAQFDIMAGAEGAMAIDFGRVARGVVDAIADGVFPLYAKAARDLSQEEAMKLLKHLASKGEIFLHEPIKNERQAQVFVQTSMAGIEFLHAQRNNNGKFGSVNAAKTPFFQPTPAFAIVLYRFAQELRETWGATHIVWGGIGGGSGKHTSDCHMTGSCLDFYGARTTRGGTFDVRRDWFNRTVYRKDGTPHAQDDGDRWGTDRQTHYRLLVTKDAEERLLDDKDYRNPRARDFFLDVFKFISAQCAFGQFDISPTAMRSGGNFMAGFTVHPDYPTLLRRPHNDHVHFQLGEAVHKA
jgi:hypothetical protein